MAEKILEGWKLIAWAARMGESTARRYASRRGDPLPVHGDRTKWATVPELQAWARRNDRALRPEAEQRAT